MHNLNYGQVPNSKMCSCGKHFGIGQFSPLYRAERYAFQRDRLFPHMTDAMKYYLASWEENHGAVVVDWQPRPTYAEQWQKFLAQRRSQQLAAKPKPDTRIYA